MSKQCTNCKKIFDDSETMCPDCKIELVAIDEANVAEAVAPIQEEDREISVFSLQSEDAAVRAVEYLKENGIESRYQYALRERIYKIFVMKSASKDALRAYTSFYALEAKRIKEEEDRKRAEEEAKRKAEEEARRKAEEEERKKKEEEERKLREEQERREREEQERIAAQQAAIKAAEEEAKRKKEQAERAKLEAEEKLKAEEAARLAAIEEAKRKAAEVAKQKAAEVERLKAQAEEAKAKAEEARLRVEQEARRRAEEEKKRAEEEALKRKAEEEAKVAKEREERRNRFAASFSEGAFAEEEKTERKFNFDNPNGAAEENATKDFADFEKNFNNSLKSRFDFIQKVDGEQVDDDQAPSPAPANTDAAFDSNAEVDDGPIFVETEPVDEYEIGDTIVVDAVEVDPNEEPEVAPEPEVVAEPEATKPLFEEPAANDSPFGESTSDSSSPFDFSAFDKHFEEIKNNPTEEKAEPVVEDMFTDNVFANTDTTKSSDVSDKIFEEVISDDLKSEASTSANKFAAAFAAQEKAASSSSSHNFAKKFDEMANGIDDIDSGTYRGFVPDYHTDDGEDEDTKTAKAYGFDPDKYKELKEKAEKKGEQLKEKAKEPKAKAKNKDFIVEDEVKVDEYQGFVPDYSSKDDNMSYYTSKTEIDYSKYRTKSDDDSNNSLTSLKGTLRSINTNELNKVFSAELLKVSAHPKDLTALKNTNYVLALTGGQLNSLFTSWLITNCTKQTVKQYEKASATSDTNYGLKIEGIKSLLRSNFGKLDDATLDLIVTKFYNKYLDE